MTTEPHTIAGTERLAKTTAAIQRLTQDLATGRDELAAVTARICELVAGQVLGRTGDVPTLSKLRQRATMGQRLLDEGAVALEQLQIERDEAQRQVVAEAEEVERAELAQLQTTLAANAAIFDRASGDMETAACALATALRRVYALRGDRDAPRFVTPFTDADAGLRLLGVALPPALDDLRARRLQFFEADRSTVREILAGFIDKPLWPSSRAEPSTTNGGEGAAIAERPQAGPRRLADVVAQLEAEQAQEATA